MVKLPQELIDRIGRHAMAEYPRECCGILIGRSEAGTIRVEEVVAARNVAEAGRLRDRYVVDPLTIVQGDREAASRGLEIVGFYHSHPNHPPTPSTTDLAAAWPSYVYLIQRVAADGVAELRGWQLTANLRDFQEVEIAPS